MSWLTSMMSPSKGEELERDAGEPPRVQHFQTQEELEHITGIQVVPSVFVRA